jgi:hypothetical protein
VRGRPGSTARGWKEKPFDTSIVVDGVADA